MPRFAAASLVALAILVFPAGAVIVDRVAVTVGNKVITHSEIDLRIRLTAYQNRGKPDLGLDSRRAAAQQLIDQKLVEREMDIGRYPRLEPQRKTDLLAEYEKANYSSDARAFMSALAAYRLSPEDIEDDLARQSDLLAFLNLRFRPAVQVTEQDIQRYFSARTEAQEVTLDQLRPQIEEQLILERSDRELDAWLREQRKTTKIEFAEPELNPSEPEPK